jgi:hypothetical protein
LQDEAGTQLFAEPSVGDRRILEGSRRMIGDHQQIGDFRQAYDDVFVDTVAEILAAWAAGQISEGKHRK